MFSSSAISVQSWFHVAAYTLGPRSTRMFTMSSLLMLFHFLFTILGCSCFVIPPDDFRSSARVVVNSSSKEKSEGEDSTIISWTTEEDWALMDKVPKFTVGEATQARTFWTQLSIATPEFGSRTVNELQERYNTLSKEVSSSLPRAGESPPILQDWTIDDATGKVSGEYQGRTVWLQSQMVGRINEDPFAGELKPTSMPGGFVEAVGGRVYELGQPAKLSSATDSTAMDRSTAVSKNDDNNQLPSFFSNKATSLIATAVVSAVISFGAASSNLQPQSSSRPSTFNQPSQMAAIVRSAPVVVKNTGTNERIDYSQGVQSISEKRARSEAKLLRDERVKNTLAEKLAQDKQSLQKLRIQEASASAVSDNEEVRRIAEQRAKIEARTFREERVIQKISDRLGPEQAEFQNLQAKEASERSLLPSIGIFKK